MLVPLIPVWEGCDPGVSQAIERFQNRWRPSSTTGHTLRLIKELIDPAIAACTAALPAHYSGHLPGAGTVAFSEIARLVGFKGIGRAQSALLRTFAHTQDAKSANGQRFIATLETLIGLIATCARKRPTKAHVRDTRFGSARRRGFCRFCGALAEFTSFANGNDDIEIYPVEAPAQQRQKTLRLSNLYCETHRPKLPNGDWNPAYRSAKRSLAQFDRELKRLSRQCARPRVGEAQSGDPIVDAFFFDYVRVYDFQPADEAELRHHARWMADNKLSDRKKQMLMLQRYGTSQSDTARRLGIQRQAVFKALASIPNMYRHLPLLPGPSSHSVN